MSFTLTFESLEDKIPEHGQEILYFDSHTDGWGFKSNELHHGEVFYVWSNGNGTTWVYEGESEFVYDDGSKPEEEIELVMCIETGRSAFQCGPVSAPDPFTAKRIHWIDAEAIWDVFSRVTQSGCTT